MKSKGERQYTSLGFVRRGFVKIACLASFLSFFLISNSAFSQGFQHYEYGTRLDLRSSLLGFPVDSSFNDVVVHKHKSPGLAVFASLAVPGLGELYSGRYDVGKYSTIAEASLWIFYTIMEIHSEQVRNDAISYAKVYAGAQVAGKPDQFFVDIGSFLNTNDFNTAKIHDGDYDLIYTSASYKWQWQSDADQLKYKDMRIEADQFLNYGRYTSAVIILNHIISAIDAARLVAGVNASAVTSLDNSPQTSGIYLKLAASF